MASRLELPESVSPTKPDRADDKTAAGNGRETPDLRRDSGPNLLWT